VEGGFPRHCNKTGNDLARRSVEKENLAFIRQRNRYSPMFKLKNGRRIGIHKYAVPVVAKENGSGKYVSPPWCVNFRHGALGRFAHAVHAVEPLSHAVCNARVTPVAKRRPSVFGRLGKAANPVWIQVVQSRHISLSRRPP
jgi:hypothetical protein